jgi:hypothetical protein
VLGYTCHELRKASLLKEERVRRAQKRLTVGFSSTSTLKVTQVSGWLHVDVHAVCSTFTAERVFAWTYSTGQARVTTSSHLHNHALAALDTQAVSSQQELSAALVNSVQEWAQCGLATTAIRQLVQLELGVPFLTSDTKKRVRW